MTYPVYSEIIKAIVELRDSLLFLDGDKDDFELIADAARRLAKVAQRLADKKP